MIIGSITQQPNEKMDYDIDFSEWMPAGDVITLAAVSVLPAGLTASYAIQSPAVKVWLDGGTAGVTYKVTVLATTNDGRKKEVELKVKVKDY